MKHLFLFLLFASVATAQTKQQLLDYIIELNQLHSPCYFQNCEETEPYKKFLKLKGMCSVQELFELTKHDNAVVRMYAMCELITTGKGDAGEFYEAELKKDEEVFVVSGISMWLKTHEVIYLIDEEAVLRHKPRD